MSATAYVLPVESGETALSRRRRSTSSRSMMTAGLDRDDVAWPGAGATWGEASDKAQRLLLEERSAGVHPIDKYVGLNAMEKNMYRSGFIPRGRCCRVYQYVGGLMLVPSSFLFLRVIGCHLLSQIAMAMVTFNWFVKIPAIGKLYVPDDAIVYRLLRMMPDALRRRSMRRSGMANSSGCVLPLSLMTYAALFALCGMVELDGLGIAVASAFWVLMFTCPHIYVVSLHFVGLARGLSECIGVLNIFCYENGPRHLDSDNCHSEGGEKNNAVRRVVNWKAAFKNYHIVYDTVERFSLGFASYFFLAEFFLVVALACLCIAVYIEVTVLLGMPLNDDTARAWTMQFLRVVVVTIWACSYGLIGAAIFSAASSITGSARQIKFEALGSAPCRARGPVRCPSPTVYDHVVAGGTLRFRSMGIVISPSLVAKLAYTLASLASAALLFLARSAHG